MRNSLSYLQRTALVKNLTDNVEQYRTGTLEQIASKAGEAVGFQVSAGNIRSLRKQLDLPIGQFRESPKPVAPEADLSSVQRQLDRLTFVVMQIANELGVKLEEKSPGGNRG